MKFWELFDIFCHPTVQVTVQRLVESTPTRLSGAPESFLVSVEKGLDEDANTGEPGVREEADREAALDLVSILAHTHTNSHGLTAVYAKNPTVQRGRKREMWMLVDESIFQTEDATEPAAAEPSNVVVDGKRVVKTVGKKRKRKASRKQQEADQWQRERQRQGTRSPGDAVVGMLQKVAEYQRNDSVAEGTFAGVVPLCGVPEENATLANDGIVPSMQAMYGMTVSPAACATNPKTPLWSIQSPGSEGEERQRPRS